MNVQQSTKVGRHSTTDVSRTFPQFLKLPPELQSMIWALYRDTLPITHYHLTVFKHKTTTTTNGGAQQHDAIAQPRNQQRDRFRRVYTTIDPRNSRQCWKTIASKTDPLITYFISPLADVTAHRIRIPGQVYVHTRNLPFNNTKQGFDISYLGRIWANVNFLVDVIIFGVVSGSQKGAQSYFRFLSPELLDPFPPTLPDDHWFFNIRKLAIHGETGNSDTPLTLSPFDIDCLSRLRKLKVVYIIVGVVVRRLWRYLIIPRAADGFVTMSDVQKLYAQLKIGCPFRKCVAELGPRFEPLIKKIESVLTCPCKVRIEMVALSGD